MSETVCRRLKLRPGSIERVKEWARELTARREEVLLTLRDEQVTVESAFLEHAADGDYLVYYMRARSMAEARSVAQSSPHAIDAYHKQFMRDVVEEGTTLELLVDFECRS